MIYFIQSGDSGPVKIGKALNPEVRRSELQTGSSEQLHLRAILDVEDDVERHMHVLLDPCRIRGEWFSSDEMILNVAMACALAGHVWDPFNVRAATR